MRDDTIAIYEGWTRTTSGGRRREEERRQSQNAFGAESRRVRNLVCHLTVKSFVAVAVVRLKGLWLWRLGFRIPSRGRWIRWKKRHRGAGDEEHYFGMILAFAVRHTWHHTE